MKNLLAKIDEYLTPFWLFSFLFIVVIFILCIYPASDSDTFLHLRTGQYIYETHSVPKTDIFSYTIFGKSWVDHEWLSQLIYFITYKVGNISLLIIFKALLACSIFLLMILSARNIAGWAMFIIYAAAFIVMKDWIRERPQMFTYLFCALYFYIFRAEKKRLIWLVPLFQLVWVNFHGAVALIGIVITVIYLFYSKAFALRSKAVIIILSAGAMFLNPNGYKIIRYLYDFYTQGLNRVIVEHLPVHFKSIFYPFFALSVVVTLLLAINPRKKPADYAVIIGSMISAYLAIRNIPVFAVFSAPVAAECLTAIGGSQSRERKMNSHGNEPLGNIYLAFRMLYKFLIMAVFLAVFWVCANAVNNSPIYRFGFGILSPCTNASLFLKDCIKAGFKGNIFNEYDFGGYLMWDLYPENKVFVDGRLVEYGSDFIGWCSNYQTVPGMFEAWDRKYSFSAVIVRPTKEARSFFNGSSIWVPVYFDNAAIVYFKDNSKNKRFISKFAIRRTK